MKLVKYFIFFILIFLNQFTTYAQYLPVALTGTELRAIHSDIVNQDFEIYVKLPWNYEKDDKAYPVLYVTDANRTFPIYSTLSLIYETPGNNNEEIIIVGIAYRVNPRRIIGLADWAAKRNRDLRPERDIQVEKFWQEKLSKVLGEEYEMVKTGQAEKFLKFIKTELIPFIEKNYRVLKNDRGLAGYSLGGLFVLYTLFNSPETFSKYFAGSPTNITKCIEYADKFNDSHKELESKLFMSSNENENKITSKGILQLADKLNKMHNKKLKIHTSIFKNESHISGGAAAISRALRTLYYDK